MHLDVSTFENATIIWNGIARGSNYPRNLHGKKRLDDNFDRIFDPRVFLSFFFEFLNSYNLSNFTLTVSFHPAIVSDIRRRRTCKFRKLNYKS